VAIVDRTLLAEPDLEYDFVDGGWAGDLAGGQVGVMWEEQAEETRLKPGLGNDRTHTVEHDVLLLIVWLDDFEARRRRGRQQFLPREQDLDIDVLLVRFESALVNRLGRVVLDDVVHVVAVDAVSAIGPLSEPRLRKNIEGLLKSFVQGHIKPPVLDSIKNHSSQLQLLHQ
jgi:hypothetical protein